jgi:MinD-like ATPase involved in chromosome partitioning or flagellar assembly
VACTSPHGAPGKTTLAVNLAAATAAREGSTTPVALLDLDLRGGNVGIVLGLDPRYNLFQLGSSLEAGHEFARAVADELQEVRPGLHVLGGIAVPSAMLGVVSPTLVQRLIAHLSGRFGWLFVDLPSAGEASGLVGACTTVALEAADAASSPAGRRPRGLIAFCKLHLARFFKAPG